MSQRDIRRAARQQHAQTKARLRARRALASLFADIRREGRPSLPWAIEHAPDGDLDAAIAKFWSFADSWVAKTLLSEIGVVLPCVIPCPVHAGCNAYFCGEGLRAAFPIPPVAQWKRTLTRF